MKNLPQVAFLLLLSASCRTQSVPSGKWSFADDLGVAILKAGKVCLGIHNPSLIAGNRIRLLNTMPPQKELGHAEISAADKNCEEALSCDADLRCYQLRVPSGELSPSVPVIAIASFSGSFGKQ